MPHLYPRDVSLKRSLKRPDIRAFNIKGELVTKLFVIIEKRMFSLLLFASAVFFILAVFEKTRTGLADNPFEAAIQAVALDPKPGDYTLYLHFFINLTLAWAVLKILMASAGLKIDNFFAKNFMKDHIIIISKSPKSSDVNSKNVYKMMSLAIDLAGAIASDRKVILVADEIDDFRRAILWENGIRVLNYTGNFTAMLTASGAAKANTLIALCDDPLDNIAICRAALSPTLKNNNLQVRCLINPLRKKHLFNPEEYFEKDSLVRLRIFNQAELLARKLFLEFPPDAAVAQSSDRVHIILLGLTAPSEALIRQAVKLGHYKSGKHPKVTIVDSDIEKKLAQSSAHLTSFRKWIEIIQCDSDLELLEAGKVKGLLSSNDAVTVAYICTNDEIINLRLAILFLEIMEKNVGPKQIKSFKVVALDPPGGTVLSDFYLYGKHAGKFHTFSLVGKDKNAKKSFLVESLLSDLDDTVSRSLHQSYVEKDLQMLKDNPDHKVHPNSVPWDQLPENIRDANRSVADHFEIKLRAVGCKMVAKEIGKEAQLNTTEIELLAFMEHQRWWADRSINGWKFAKTRDDQNRLHPNMLPYDELSEADKQKDRDSVLKMLDVFRSKGYRVVRSNQK